MAPDLISRKSAEPRVALKCFHVDVAQQSRCMLMRGSKVSLSVSDVFLSSVAALCTAFREVRSALSLNADRLEGTVPVPWIAFADC